MKRFIVGNWKANKNSQEVIGWMDKFSLGLMERKSPQVVICSSAIHFPLVKELIQEHNLSSRVSAGLQDLSVFPGGAYTGEVTARMAAGAASFVILGHSERRKYFNETVQQTARKVIQALDNNIVPVVSVDRENFQNQLGQFDNETLSKIIIMYEPPEAISVQDGKAGAGKPAGIVDIEEMIESLNRMAFGTKIVYGGSVTGVNISDFSKIQGLSGIVVGSASLDADEFIKIINQI